MTIRCDAMCLCHSFVPDDLINTTVAPLLENKSCDTSDVNNYRAIALSNCLSTILESLHDTELFSSI